MDELNYPFNANKIMTEKRRIKKELLENSRSLIDKNIAVLGGSTTHHIVSILELFLLNYGIQPHFYESKYGQYMQEGLCPTDAFANFKPDLVYIFTTNRNVSMYPSINTDLEQVDQIIVDEFSRFKGLWDKIYEVHRCPIIQNNFEMPSFRLLGNKDASDYHGAVNFLTRLNMLFYEYAQKHDYFFICDINYISADYGLKKWSNPLGWYLYKYALDLNAIPYLSFNIAKIIKSIFGKNKKGFVLDLDNTLWGGVIGDDGIENIKIGEGDPEGEMFASFQKYIKLHKELGVLLNIASKNNVDNALAGLNHPSSVLKPDDFVCIESNWKPKDESVSRIADSLNILTESLVFVDDNPAEREFIAKQIPGISVPNFETITNCIYIIDRSGFFESTVSTQDDVKRNDMYRENLIRKQSESKFKNYDEYLQYLCMQAEIRAINNIVIPRAAQLINKSNQFNLTPNRYTQQEVEKIANSNKWITLYGRLKDIFGDYGVVSVLFGRIEGITCHIELFVLSCRAFNRELENAMVDELAIRCIQKNITNIRGYYVATSKNNIAKSFFRQQGFRLIEANEGNSVWHMKLNKKYERKARFININVNKD